MKAGEKRDFVKETADYLINSGNTLEENITTAMTILHVVVDAELAKTTKTLGEIRATKRKIGEAVASYLDADLDEEVFG